MVPDRLNSWPRLRSGVMRAWDLTPSPQPSASPWWTFAWGLLVSLPVESYLRQIAPRRRASPNWPSGREPFDTRWFEMSSSRGLLALPYERLVEIAPSISQVALTLIGARAVGANIGLDALANVLEQAQSPEAWEAFTWLGDWETRWVLEHHPELAVALAAPLLYHAPRKTIPFLLDAAVGDRRELHSHPDHPLRRLQDWVQDTEPDTSDGTTRRRVVLTTVAAWLEAGNDEDVGTHALTFAVLPKFQRQSTDPGMGMTVTIRSGPLSLARLREVEALWSGVVTTIRSMETPAWRYLLRAVEDWAYPSRLSNTGVPPDVAQALRATARGMIIDLVAASRGHQGVLRRLKALAENLSLDVGIVLDPAFDVLFPSKREYRDAQSYQRIEAAQASAADALATDYVDRDLLSTARLIVRYEQEAREAGIRWPRYTPRFCSKLASLSFAPCEWSRTLLELAAPPDLLEPFLREAARRNEPGWQDLADSCLARPEAAPVVLSLLLTSPLPDEGLLAKSFALLPEFTGIVEFHCLRDEVAENTLGQLLRHEDPAVACAAAVGHWQADPSGAVHPSLRDGWRSALMLCAASYDELKRSRRYIDDNSASWIAQILQSDSNLAFDWVKARLSGDLSGWWLELDRPDAVAVGALSLEQRVEASGRAPGGSQVRSADPPPCWQRSRCLPVSSSQQGAIAVAPGSVRRETRRGLDGEGQAGHSGRLLTSRGRTGGLPSSWNDRMARRGVRRLGRMGSRIRQGLCGSG